MIAEFADYQSWIAWVPIVALLAVPLVLRRVLALSFAMCGAFVGFIVVTLTNPLGSMADQLGPNLALGLVGGAVVGVLIGLVVTALRSRSAPNDASVIIVGSAIGSGVLGALVAAFGPSLLAGAAPDLNVTVLAAIAIGGGIGWAAGAAYGWHRARNSPPPGAAQRWLLIVAAVSTALFGAGIVITIQTHAFGPSIDEMTRAERTALPSIAALYCIDVAIAVSTMIAAAARGPGAQWQAVVPESV